MKKVKSIAKYNKITQQQKFHLLTLVLNENLLIKQAAKQVGINYSTAKTIIFFHRNNGKSYQFDLHSIPDGQNCEKRVVATFVELPTCEQRPKNASTWFSPIAIISTIGSKSLLYFQNGTSSKYGSGINHSHSSSHKNIQNTNYQVNERAQMEQRANCQIEKRITRAQSALKAKKNEIEPMMTQLQPMNQQQCIELPQKTIEALSNQ